MPDLEQIIVGAVSEATEAPETSETPEASVETPETPETPTPEEAETPETPAVEGVEAVKTADTEAAKESVKPEEKDQLTKDLEELGLKAPKEGERENRLPYSRVKKITENFGRKVEARFTQEVSTLRSENEGLKKRAETFDKVEGLIATEPERYLTLLSTIHPEYKRFLQPAANPAKETAKPAAQAQTSQLGPRPQPDHKFEDGSMGYTPDQHEKLLEWVAAKAREDAVAEAEKRFTERFGPIEERYRANEELQARIPQVKAQTAAIYETWGKELVEKHEGEIVALMRQNPTMSATEATARVLVPKVRADRNTMREEVRQELSARPKAAAKTVPASTTAEKPGAGEETGDPIENAILGAVASLRR